MIYPNYVQVIFRAIRGKSYTSDIAIDEIELIHGSCGVANNITPWKVYGQAVVESIRDFWFNDKETTKAQTTTSTAVSSTIQPTSQTSPRIWYCDKKANVTFDPIDEACCGGQVRKKHKWVSGFDRFINNKIILLTRGGVILCLQSDTLVISFLLDIL